MAELIYIFIMMIIQVIIPPIPAELIVLGVASKYGLILTTIIAGSGLFIGSLFVFFFSSFFRKFFKINEIRSIEKKFQKYGFWILLIRVLPYNPSDIISYVSGILGFDKKRYIIITFFTSYTRVFLLSILGINISSIFELIAVFFLLLLSGILLTYYLYGKKKIFTLFFKY